MSKTQATSVPASRTVSQAKAWTLRLASLALLALALPAMAQTTEPKVKDIPFEFKPLSEDFALTDKFAVVEKARLKIDTRKSSDEWNSCFKTGIGLLKPDTDYTIDVKFKPLEIAEDSAVLFLIRPFNAGDSLSDLGQATWSDAAKTEKSVKLKFHIPAKSEQYSFQIHTRKKALAMIESVAIKEGSFLKVQGVKSENAPAVMPELPKGCEEFAIDLPKPKGQETASVDKFGASEANPDNAKAFNAAIDYCAMMGSAKLVVPKGVYRFTSDATIKFDKLVDFEFDGQGSTFVFLKKSGSLMSISNCERTLFKNFNIDWDWDKDPLASVVKIEGVDVLGGEYADFKFVDYESFPKRDVRVADIEQLDPETMSVGCEGAINASFEFFRGKSPAPKTEWLSGNVLRVYSKNGSSKLFSDRLKPGMLFRLRHYVYDMPGIEMRSNAHLTLSGVNVYSAPSHAFVSSGKQHHWQFLNTNIVRPPGTKRPITCTADHHHVSQSQGYFKMDGCEFSLGGDDCLNIHDCSGYGIRSADRVLSTSKQAASPGETIELRNDDYSPTGFIAKVKSSGRSNAPKYSYTYNFDEPLPEQKGEGFIIFNRTFDSGHVIVRNCYFHDNRARGLLILAHDVTIENNIFFHNQMGAIKIETGYTFDIWSEGFGASNIVIRNNTFDNVNPTGAYRNELTPAIYISVYLKTDPSQEKTMYPILHDILIDSNKFINNPGAIAYACSAKNVFVTNNSIVNDVPRKQELPYRGSVGTAYSSNVFVTGNTWEASPCMPNPALISDTETSKDAYCWGNKVVEPKP